MALKRFYAKLTRIHEMNFFRFSVWWCSIECDLVGHRHCDWMISFLPQIVKYRFILDLTGSEVGKETMWAKGACAVLCYYNNVSNLFHKWIYFSAVLLLTFSMVHSTRETEENWIFLIQLHTSNSVDAAKPDMSVYVFVFCVLLRHSRYTCSDSGLQNIDM